MFALQLKYNNHQVNLLSMSTTKDTTYRKQELLEDLRRLVRVQSMKIEHRL